jgi:ribosomal protein S18 acetylase RimI-like enzyme
VKAELIDVADPRWAAFLDSTAHDFYHLPAYVDLSARHEDGDAIGMLVTDGRSALLQPLIVRPIPGGRHDATAPYGYPGPLVRGAAPDRDFLSAALDEGIALLRRRGIVSLFLRLHPILNRALPRGVGTLRRGGDTVGIDLTKPDEDQWREIRGNHRVHINRARRNGRVARFDDDFTHLADFQRLYRGTMTRVAAHPYYFFDDAYFADLRAALGRRMRLCLVEADGTVAAAGLFVETSGIIQYHLSGSDPAFAREGLTKLMIDHVRRWGTARGDKELHLGGGQGGGSDDPLFHFKAGFSERRHEFHTLRAVLDEPAYARLSEAARRVAQPVGEDALTHIDGSPGASADYFPSYRAPRPARQDPEPAGRPRFNARPVSPEDVTALTELLAAIDTTHFRPHPMTAAQAEQIARRGGKDVYLIGFVGDVPVAYGMLRGWDEGYVTASLGVAVRRDRQGQGFGRAMMEALHDAARRRGASSLRLRVHPDNVAARRLYDGLGYRAAGMERGELLMLIAL